MNTYFFSAEITDLDTNEVYDYSFTVKSEPDKAFWDAKYNTKRWIKATLPNLEHYDIVILNLNRL